MINEKLGFPESISFAYVDSDFCEPIKFVLAFPDSTLSAGGVIVVDDYDYFSTGAKSATDEIIAHINRDRQTTNWRSQIAVADSQPGYFASITKL